MTALDSLRGFARIDWAFGGGTAMRLYYDHRESKDIDIFLNDASVLNGLSPRLNDTTATMTDRYTEQSNYVKLRFDEGEIDFIIGTRLIAGVPYDRRTIRGRSARVERPIEIVAKKCFYRAADFAVRDVFDFAVLIERDGAEIGRHKATFLAKKTVLQQRLAQFSHSAAKRATFAAQMQLVAATPRYERVKETALATVVEFLESLEPPTETRNGDRIAE